MLPARLIPSVQPLLTAIHPVVELTPDELLKLGARLVFIWLLAWVCWLLVNLVARRIIAAVDDHDDATFTAAERRGHTIAQLLRSVGRVVILALAVLLSVGLFIDITPVLGGAAILGLAVSFGAQSLVKDVISGFFILMENQFAIGDVIEAAGKSGEVERMTLRVVHLRDNDGSLHVIPNGLIGVVSNQTRGWSRAVVDVGVSYESNIDRVIEIFGDEAGRLARDPAWAGVMDGAPEVQGVAQLGDSSVVIRTRLRTEPGKQWQVAREFRRRIKARLEREGVDIPFPQMVVRQGPVKGA